MKETKTKADYYKEKASFNLYKRDDLKNWLFIQSQFLQFDLNWNLDEFIREYDAFEDYCGPFIEQDYNSQTGELNENKCYHSKTIFDTYLARLENVFENYIISYNYSEKVLVAELSKFKTLTSVDTSGEIHFFYKKHAWKSFSKSKNIPWSVNIIRQFATKWHWKHLLSNSSISWTEEMLNEFLPNISAFTWKTDFDESIEINAWNGLLLNCHLQVNYESIVSHAFDWEYLALNKGINFSIDFLHYLNSELFPLISRDREKSLPLLRKNFFGNLYKNKTIIWTYEILREFKILLNWHDSFFYWNGSEYCNEKLSHFKKLFFDEEFINDFADVLDFKFISSSKNIKWTNELIILYSEKWDWRRLKDNKEIFWNSELEEIYKSKNIANDSLSDINV